MTAVCLLVAAAWTQAPADGLPAAPVTAIAFAPGGKTVVVATPHEASELSWPELKVRRKLLADLERIHDLAFSPDGRRLALAGGKPGEAGGVVLLAWPVGKVSQQMEAAGDVVYRAAWLSGGNTLSLACADKAVHLVPLVGERRINLEEHSAAVLSTLAIPAQERELLATAGRDQTIRIWDLATPAKSLRSFDNHTGAVHDLALQPASGDSPPILASAGADRTVRFWMPTVGRMLRFSRLASPPLAICWTKDGQRVAAACQDGKLRIVELATVRSAVELPAVDGWAYSIALAPDGQSVLVGGENGQLKAVTLPQENDP
jgi:WD40 repeat protein